MHVLRKLRFLGLSLALGTIPLPLFSQSSLPSGVGALDSGIPVPTITGVPGQHDSAALIELTEHDAVVGTALWQGMQGTGQITYGSADPTSYNATISMIGSDSYRLDAQSSKGTMSLRIDGGQGKIQGKGGVISAIPLETAMAGLFPFGMVRGVHSFGKLASFIDHGLVTEEGTSFHRVTIERPSIGRDPVTKLTNRVAIDFYFDPATHLLRKSASYSLVSEGHSASFLRVVTYSDYRRSGTSMIPFHYTESMNGEPYWTLQLSDVQLNPALDATYFKF